MGRQRRAACIPHRNGQPSYEKQGRGKTLIVRSLTASRLQGAKKARAQRRKGTKAPAAEEQAPEAAIEADSSAPMTEVRQKRVQLIPWSLMSDADERRCFAG